MRKLLYCLIAVSIFGAISAQESKNVSPLSHVALGEESSDIWGYTDNSGLEYAIIGVTSGIKIFSLADPATPQLIEHILADRSIWRDIKSFHNKLYAVADEGNDGILVINMENVPDSVSWHFVNPKLDFENLKGEIKTCHNLFIDSLGYVYLAGCNPGNRGVIICQITDDSMELLPVGNTNIHYSHDVFAGKDLMFSSDVFSGQLSIYDITDRSRPVLRSSVQTGNSFTHNAWASGDNKYVFTTDEVEGAYVEAYKIEDLDNIEFLDRIRSNRINSPNVIVHNVHFYNNYLITSHYTEGVTIVDAESPGNLIEIGYYDSFDNESNIAGKWFDGCWGAFPYYESGILAISDISNGLFILKPTYLRAARLEGVVKDLNSGIPIRNASVEFLNRPDLLNYTDLGGGFKTGSADEGAKSIIVDHPLYDRKELTVDMKSEVTLEVEVFLSSLTFTANITNELNQPLLDVKVKLIETDNNNTIVFENIDGILITPLSSNKKYTLIFSRWGKQEKIIENFQLNENGMIDVIMQDGYEDSYELDHNWDAKSFASSGSWQLGTPIAKTYNGILLQPNFDSPYDLGFNCYFTNLSGGGSNSGDVDNGYVVLTSPDLMLKNDATYDLSFDYWFSNERGNVLPDDSLTIWLYSNDQSLHIATITESGQSWRNHSTKIFIDNDKSSSFNLKVTAYDNSPNDHVVEAGIDNFKLIESSAVFINKELHVSDLQIYPNPVDDILNINSESLIGYELKVFDIDGKFINQKLNLSEFNQINVSDYKPGLYIIKLTNKNNQSVIKRFLKI